MSPVEAVAKSFSFVSTTDERLSFEEIFKVYLTIAEPNGSVSLSIESVLGDMTGKNTNHSPPETQPKYWPKQHLSHDPIKAVDSETFKHNQISGSKRRNCAKRALGTSSKASGPLGGMGTVWGQTAEKRSALRTFFHLNCIAIVVEFGALTITIALVFVAVNVIVVVCEVFEVTIVDVATLWLSFMFMSMFKFEFLFINGHRRRVLLTLWVLAQTTMISFAIHCQYADEIS
uniref:Uncharacterized protein n=1 Tax=Glossina austeni TaxID=7395 RepID=A0A1A9UYT4_GLOAU